MFILSQILNKDPMSDVQLLTIGTTKKKETWYTAMLFKQEQMIKWIIYKYILFILYSAGFIWKNTK